MARTIIELQTPIEDGVDDDVDEECSTSSSSSTPESRASFSLKPRTEPEFDSDDLAKDLEVLEQLRRSVHQNLRLRPIRSVPGSLQNGAQRPAVASMDPTGPPLNVVTDLSQFQRSYSPDDAFSPPSAYYTPLTEFRGTPLSAFHQAHRQSLDMTSRNLAPPPAQPAQPVSTAGIHGISPALLLARLSSPTRPLLIDTRPPHSFDSTHLKGSINIAIPSLILKRSRKPAGALQSLDGLRQFITTEGGKREWDELMSGNDWDGDIIVFDEKMSEKERQSSQTTAWAIMDVVAPLLRHGIVDYLEGGFAAVRQHPYLSQLLESSADTGPEQSRPVEHNHAVASSTSKSVGSAKKPPGGLFQLDTSTAARSKALPQIEQPTPSSQAIMPSAVHSWNIIDDHFSPSPAPSSTVFSRPTPRRPSIPTLRRLDTDRPVMPRLQVPNVNLKPNTLSINVNGAGKSRSRSRSPSHPSLLDSDRSPPQTSHLLYAGPSTPYDELRPPPSPGFGQPTTPRSPRTPLPPSPATARPDLEQPPTTEDPFPEFTISTILPNFLYLGPELTSPEHVDALLSLGVKRIVNIAAECDDDHGLNLRQRFERYTHIPMRDTVEEDNITRGVRDVCAILGECVLHHL